MENRFARAMGITGAGLTLIKKFVFARQGKVSVAENKGRGTRGVHVSRSYSSEAGSDAF